MYKRSSSAPTISGHRRLRSSAALHSYQTRKMAGSEVRSFSLAAAQQAAPAVTEPRFIISLDAAPNRPGTLELQWSEAIRLCLNLVHALRMSCAECSGPH